MSLDFMISILDFTCITLIAVCGTFLVTGMTGFFSLGQSGFMALGAYTSALLMMKLDMPFIVGVPAAVAVGALAGYMIAKPTAKLKRDYFSLITFGFTSAVTAVLNSAIKLTNGGMGLSGIPKHVNTIGLVVSAAAVVLLIRNFKYSRLGRQCLALRTDELAAKSMGIDTDRTKIIVFMFSAAITGYAGALYAHYLRYIDPNMFTWMQTAEWIIIVFVGGTASITGSVIVTILLKALPELLRFADEWRIVIYSLIVLFTVNFRPKGLLGEFELFPRRYQLNNKGTSK